MTHTDNKTIYELIARKLCGQASEVELRALRELTAKAGFDAEEISEIERAWAQPVRIFTTTELLGQKEKAEELWQKSFVYGSTHKRKRINISFIARIAATFVILNVFGALVFKMVQPEDQIQIAITTITKQTPAGQKATITLKDGTVVWLNSGSKISFASNFNDSIREISLEGQAYIEVFKDPNMPFRVNCRDIVVEAIGTSFDINCYADMPMQVSLVSGSVKVSDNENGKEMMLKPGEYSRYSKEDEFIGKGKFDKEYLLAWKDGKVIFKNATIDVIIARLELWYGVKIENLATIPKDKPFTGVFVQENLENILMNIGNVMDFEYSIKGNNVVLKKSLPM